MSFKLKGHFYLNYKKHPTKPFFYLYTYRILKTNKSCENNGGYF